MLLQSDKIMLVFNHRYSSWIEFLCLAAVMKKMGNIVFLFFSILIKVKKNQVFEEKKGGQNWVHCSCTTVINDEVIKMNFLPHFVNFVLKKLWK